MINIKEIIGSLDLTKQKKEIQDNISLLLEKINEIRKEYNKPMTVTSGFRSMDDHIRIYKNKALKKEKPFTDGIYSESKVPMKSKHLYGQAVDISDPNGDLQAWCLSNEDKLKQIGLWCEHFDYTKNWVHFQTLPPKSGNRFFIP